MSRKILREQLRMANYWIDDKGMKVALEVYLTEVVKDPQIAAAQLQMENAVLAIERRIEQLQEEHNAFEEEA